MVTWKFSIKPDSKPGFDAFQKCMELSLVGIGWSHGYEKEQPKDFEHAKKLLKKQWPNDGIAKEIIKLFFEIKPGDHLWLHKNGFYYLCIPGSKKFIAREICKDFRNYDLGHALEVKWIKVLDELVSGSIQRGIITPRMIQRINISESESNVNKYLAEKLSKDPSWFPVVDSGIVRSSIDDLSTSEIFKLLSPDDVEDIIAAMLQADGWILIKSTCFRSKPKFEFSMINHQGKIGLVQVKSGEYPDRLTPSKYVKHLTKENQIFLFSTHPDPYPGGLENRITCISKDKVVAWIRNNTQLLSYPLRLKLSIKQGFLTAKCQ